MKRRRVAVAGGGLGGALMAIYLARRDFEVDVFERRSDVRKGVTDTGRSINLTIAERGLWSLEPIGLREAVTAITMPIKGRLVHGEDGKTRFQRYGRSADQIHRSVKRSELNALLLDAASADPRIRLSFHTRYLRGAKTGGRLAVQDVRSGETSYLESCPLFGADGSHSVVRAEMHAGEMADYEQHFLPEGYKELTVPAAPGGGFQLDPEVLHVWPRGEAVLIAIANRDGSFSCTCTLPWMGEDSFESLTTPAATCRFFEQAFPDVLALAPGMADEFLARSPGRYITTMTEPWHYRDRIVLLGDSCHSVLPFYGQGMNAALEDCRTLDDCLGLYPEDWTRAFAVYESRRKRHTDALARLSQQNYVELKELVRSPMFLAKRRVELVLDRWWPQRFATLYSLISHTTTPYADAVEYSAKRERWLNRSGLRLLLLTVTWPLAAMLAVEMWWNNHRRRPRRRVQTSEVTETAAAIAAPAPWLSVTANSASISQGASAPERR